ncbi:hypothetical protein BD310DRAFT_942037 [Dichomitus squalens]|uniref:Uncharacterized protein n=1 Tax=Dichomitus squalens TaxID=114155 RepID=A0A4Q9PA58_9APHY|nr:hypothetical protein BD310DRAFT_942037 [Dichomitus squalens]
MFFVATTPLSADRHINVLPRLSNRVWYEDLSGSGILMRTTTGTETILHL